MRKLTIFICAHNRIDNELPNDDYYIIAAQNDNVDNDYPKIIMNDEFVQKHKRGYGELCQMHYLYKHQELLSDYVGFCHYRRFFNFLPSEEEIIYKIDHFGPIFHQRWTANMPNIILSIVQHTKLYSDAMTQVIEEYYPEYKDTLQEWYHDKYSCYCNMFIMKKEDFLKGCDFVFGVLDKIDILYGLYDDDCVKRFIENLSEFGKWNNDKYNWQLRMQGFIGEYLWDIFRRKNFDKISELSTNIVGEKDKSYHLTL